MLDEDLFSLLPPPPKPDKLFEEFTRAGFSALGKALGEVVASTGAEVVTTGARVVTDRVKKDFPIGIGDYLDRNPHVEAEQTTINATHYITQDEAEGLLEYMSPIRFVPEPPGQDIAQSPEETLARGAGDCEDHAILASKNFLIPRNIWHKRRYGWLLHGAPTYKREGHSWIELGPDLVYDHGYVGPSEGRYIFTGRY